MRRTLLSAVAGVLLLTACSGGDDTAERSQAYVDAVGQWQSTVLAPTTSRVEAATFSDLVVVGRAETRAQAAAQDARCTQIAQARDAVAALTPPALPGEATDQVQALADGLTASTAAYRDAAGPALSELATYCAAYDEARDLEVRKAAAERALAATLTKQGVLSRTTTRTGMSVTTTTITCDVPLGCIPGRAQLPAYLKAYKTARIDLTRTEHQLLGGVSTPCRLTDYAPVCRVYVATLPGRLAAYQRVYDTVRSATSTFDNPAIDTANEAADAQATRLSAAYRAAYRATFPTVDLSVADYPTRNELVLLRRYESAAAGAPVPSTALPTAAPTPR